MQLIIICNFSGNTIQLLRPANQDHRSVMPHLQYRMPLAKGPPCTDFVFGETVINRNSFVK